MQDASYQLILERLVQCEELAAQARDPTVRAKAAQLAHGYRKLIHSFDQPSWPSDVGTPRRKSPSLWIS
jgi:hypothetical protein